jgi:hypothetical protein
MNIQVKVGAKGNEAQLAAVEAVLASVEGAELVGTSKLAYNKYYKVTVTGAEGITDEDGDAVEVADDIVSYVKSKEILTDKQLLSLAQLRADGATASARKEKRVIVEEISRSDWSIAVNDGLDMGDEKITYSIIDTRGLCKVIGSFKTQLVLDDADKVYAKAVEKGILQKVNLQSQYLGFTAEDKDGNAVEL